MEDFLGGLLDRIEQTGASFTQSAYGVVASEVTPLLTVLLIAYVAYYGLQLIMGTARVSVGEVISRVVRMTLIVAFINSWGNFNTFFYAWLSDTPEDVGRAILAVSNTGITEPTNGLSMIWETANKAAGAFAEQAGYFSVLPAMVGFLIMFGVGVFIAVALAILLLAKVMMWVLLGTAPIFIACLLFQSTRSYGMAWFQSVLMYAIIPLFVYVVAAFLISAMDPELTKVAAAADQRRLQLDDVAAFLLLCAAGAFVLFNIQTLAQGITGGVAAGIGQVARTVGGLTGFSAPAAALTGARSVSGAAGRIGMAARERTHAGMRENIRNASADAMQKSISSNSVPR
ncbi:MULTISPECIES: type IV secretion system protein [Agrobacterium]|uniref:Type IV secretory pathway VirB6 component n=1 Tax=Agrobacterium rubi TR3 = NBRC 13261 TaxID=1368415 RepID=A0A081D2F4_9HYPH|nr:MULTISPECIES: type IV secretion system protein [Agrobacterium]MBN7808997.1 type IV secretion system protein [Agrobacterium rosae]MBP1881314.1 type IV secretion system protein VirB6 [Agrobacterium rubi]MCE6077536.1 conjugal transfer protein TrbL [Agrobacterium vitis]MQB13106.1 conjugal transfer protein TrbL [Agrobacterium sp. ICMP 6402]GAK73100.1 type IV secretory pathway VirB6 component [Agrobacterium rubi TR3 = NBRC 13261]